MVEIITMHVEIFISLPLLALCCAAVCCTLHTPPRYTATRYTLHPTPSILYFDSYVHMPDNKPQRFSNSWHPLSTKNTPILWSLRTIRDNRSMIDPQPPAPAVSSQQSAVSSQQSAGIEISDFSSNFLHSSAAGKQCNLPFTSDERGGQCRRLP